MYPNAQRIQTATVASSGKGYSVGDVAFIPTDAPRLFCPAQFSVASVDTTGAVTSIYILNFGGFLNSPTTPATIKGGTGAGLTLNLTFTLYWQNSPWIVPTSAGLEYLLSTVVQSPVNTLADQSSRSDQCIRLAVQKIRGAIGVARRIPLSLTAASIPPEAESHCYALALQMLVGSNPNLAKYAISEAGAGKTPLALMIDDATKWLADVRGGKAVEYPSDPDPAFPLAIREGAMSDEEDLTTFSAPNYFNTPQAGWQNLGQP